jgi:hypothetical protein
VISLKRLGSKHSVTIGVGEYLTPAYERAHLFTRKLLLKDPGRKLLENLYRDITIVSKVSLVLGIPTLKLIVIGIALRKYQLLLRS